MRRKRGMALLTFALTGALVLAGCARDNDSGGGSGEPCETNDPPAAAAQEGPSEENTLPAPDGSNLRVGLAFDIGGRGDASFNDSAAAGLDRAIEELGVSRENTRELTAGANDTEAAKQTRLRQLASEGFNPVIAVGFAYAEAVETVAPEFPNVQFGLVDGESEQPNVTPLLFAEEEGSFLVGVVAALRSQTCHIGFVGGVETPLIQKFEAGYVQGARAVAPDVQIEIDYLTPAGDFTGFQDPAKGQESTKGLIDLGADVIYHAAGASGRGVFSAVAAEGVQAIGVDSDQYNQPDLAEFQSVIITSMLKRVDNAVFEFLSAAAAGNFDQVPERFDLSVDGVGYSTSGGAIDDITETVDAYRSAIINGDITVSEAP